MIKIPKVKKYKYMKNFIEEKCSLSKNKVPEFYKPDYKDLYLLYKYITLNKRLSVLEFGSGYSSIVMSKALNENKKRHFSKLKKIEHMPKFKIHSYENMKKYYLKLKKIKRKNKLANLQINYSHVKYKLINNRICTKYTGLRFKNPDFIYLDGPSPKTVKGLHLDMPMSGDILYYEHFFNPGTIIVIDGRTANSRFLKTNFQRNWIYTHDKQNDQSIFLLKENPLGKKNKALLDFYKS
mgnify:CR=1 FL=1